MATTYYDQIAKEFASAYRGTLEGTDPHYWGELLVKMLMKFHEQTQANAWHGWPNEKPPCDGKYLVVLSDRTGTKRSLAVRVFKNNNWVFSVKTDIEYWMEIPQTPIPL